MMENPNKMQSMHWLIKNKTIPKQKPNKPTKNNQGSAGSGSPARSSAAACCHGDAGRVIQGSEEQEVWLQRQPQLRLSSQIPKEK